MKRLLVVAALITVFGTPVLGASPAPAPSVPSTVHVRGKIVSFAGDVLTVGAPMGPATTVVTLAPNFRVTYLVVSSLAAIVPGSYIGTAAVPQRDGSLRAIGVTIFPPGITPNPGTFSFDLTPTSTMTNGTIETIGATKVDNAAAGVLNVTYEGGEKRVVVADGTPVVKLVPADASALVAGARVSITAKKDVDGTLSAANVNVGKDGLIPPY